MYWKDEVHGKTESVLTGGTGASGSNGAEDRARAGLAMGRPFGRSLEKIGCLAETHRHWVRAVERDTGRRRRRRRDTSDASRTRASAARASTGCWRKNRAGQAISAAAGANTRIPSTSTTVRGIRHRSTEFKQGRPVEPYARQRRRAPRATARRPASQVLRRGGHRGALPLAYRAARILAFRADWSRPWGGAAADRQPCDYRGRLSQDSSWTAGPTISPTTVTVPLSANCGYAAPVPLTGPNSATGRSRFRMTTRSPVSATRSRMEKQRALKSDASMVSI